MVDNDGCVSNKMNIFERGNLTISSLILFVLISWGVVFYQGISSAISIWSISEIFTHCFLVLPCSFYFIYKKRVLLLSHQWQPNFWLLLLLPVFLFLELFGSVGDIQLFMHIATFCSLPLIIWIVIGNKAANEIRFPLFLMLFSIPVGEQLIPYLQIITTDLAVPLIEFANVPVYRNGFYLEIPEGKFLVAEACSGISFLIASLVFGCLYSYVSFSSLSKQLLFVCISIFIPILANAIRVFGIVYTAHVTDMEYAAGADHIIYGGVFYAIIIFILLIVGEKFRDKDFVEHGLDNTLSDSKSFNINRSLIVIVTILFTVQIFWKNSVTSTSNTGEAKESYFNVADFRQSEFQQSDWQPNFIGAKEAIRGEFLSNEGPIDYYLATYVDSDGELVSSVNVLFDKDLWSMLNSQVIYIDTLGHYAVLTKLVSSQGVYRYIIHWFEFSNQSFVSQIKLKLAQTAYRLVGREWQGSLFAFSASSKQTKDNIEQVLLDYLKANGDNIKKITKR